MPRERRGKRRATQLPIRLSPRGVSHAPRKVAIAPQRRGLLRDRPGPSPGGICTRNQRVMTPLSRPEARLRTQESPRRTCRPGPPRQLSNSVARRGTRPDGPGGRYCRLVASLGRHGAAQASGRPYGCRTGVPRSATARISEAYNFVQPLPDRAKALALRFPSAWYRGQRVSSRGGLWGGITRAPDLSAKVQ